MILLNEFPIEILVNIFSHLPAKSVSSTSLVCKLFYEASQFESIWKKKCYEEYNILSTGCNLSFKELYTRLLYSHGKLFGLWYKPKYNSAFHIEYNAGRVECKMWLTPKRSSEIFKPIDFVPHFDVMLNADLEVEYNFYSESIEDPRRISLPIQSSTGKPVNNCHVSIKTINCCEENFTIIEDSRPYPRLSFTRLSRKIVICPIFYKKICIKNNGQLNVPIQPGLFCGTYGVHGVECIALNYEENGSVLVAKKITGDLNVPADQITFKAYLNQGMILDLSDQEDIDTLQLLQPELVPYNAQDKNVQSFRIPENCSLECETELPNTCIGRFQGDGHIADTYFQNDEYIKGHWIVFNEDLCAFLWFFLDCLTIYRRAHEISKYIPKIAQSNRD